ncbi:MAG TPA: caspase family protein [Candidatus Saccharimonadales bacterium]|jgi:uncharacterized caspase-like protein|nr:caspase family protein [Candidatus Saccharimonadales bacterium]
MRRLLLFVSAFVCFWPCSAWAQGDGCRGALDALNRAKEQITPKLAILTESSTSQLQVMHSALENGTRLCKDFPELWYYLMIVSQRLGLEKDYAYARKKVDAFNYDNHFDPFSVPPAAAVAPAAPPSPNTATPAGFRKKWALIVGIDQFQDESVPKLNYAAKDADDFAAFLKDPQGGRFDPGNVVYLKDQAATLKGIRAGLGKLRIQAKPGDLIVLYIASHGLPRHRDPNGVSYIIAHDTDLRDAATIYASSLQMIDLVQQINRELKARQIVLILDTCFSGDALTAYASASSETPDASSFSMAFENLKIGYGRAVLTASRANEQSWEGPKLENGGNGYFMHGLLEVLREGRGAEPIEHVFAKVQKRVAARVKSDVKADQTPSFQFSEQAHGIVLGAPETAGN